MVAVITRRVLFLSTPSARRATGVDVFLGLCRGNFYPRPPRGGRQQAHPLGRVPGVISIHALREEGDFYARAHAHETSWISIHALREEGDSAMLFFSGSKHRFLSTPSARRATPLPVRWR